MLTYPDINPVAFELGFIKVHWYGLMYLAAFASAYLLATWRAKQPGSGWTTQQVSDLIFYGAMGVVIGGRMGYVLFYNFPQFLEDPLWLFRVWEGGMSFHARDHDGSAALRIRCQPERVALLLTRPLATGYQVGRYSGCSGRLVVASAGGQDGCSDTRVLWLYRRAD